MTKFEWVLRCQRQFAIRTTDFEYDWSENAEICYAEMREGWHENDPEGCANEEISNCIKCENAKQRKQPNAA